MYQKNKLLYKSFFLNTRINPYKRLYYRLDVLNKFDIYYKSKIKLLCLFTGIKRVPNKRYFLNRFFLNKYADTLNLSIFLKK